MVCRSLGEAAPGAEGAGRGGGGGGTFALTLTLPHPRPMKGETLSRPWAAKHPWHLKRGEAEREPQGTKGPGQGPWRGSPVCLPFEPDVLADLPGTAPASGNSSPLLTTGPARGPGEPSRSQRIS